MSASGGRCPEMSGARDDGPRMQAKEGRDHRRPFLPLLSHNFNSGCRLKIWLQVELGGGSVKISRLRYM